MVIHRALLIMADQMSQHPTPNTQHPINTIAAIATAIGSCGIGVIRISGPESFEIAERVFRARGGLKVSEYASHTVHYGQLVDPENGEPIDDVLLTVFKAPASYTGEDVVELSCHGGIVTLRNALRAVFAAGAKPAEPGEFTKRAFLNGRLDLAQAEAVNDLIRARTDQAQKLALRQLDGALSREVAGITDGILAILARIEASIDFPDDVEEPGNDELAAQMRLVAQSLDRLISTSDRGRVYREGISLVIVGRPNVGKSSLLNALLRQTRAIVTAIPGTTRDIIEETISIRGIPVVATDTAGLRDTADEVERIGVELTERAMSAAEIVLIVLDAGDGLTDEDSEIIRRVSGAAIVVLNKMDLAFSDSLEWVSSTLPGMTVVPVTAVTGLGIEELEDEIASTVLHGEIGLGEGAFVTSVRHRQALGDARESILRAIGSIETGMTIDFLPTDLMAARSSLGEITGDTASDDLVDRIFSDFCIGK